ncbi:MAG: flippase [Candidatus Dormibacter sp.]|uniref:flippase n=1 Tax=Candidatus Dormibacter sp. TaxID=2973982 RepID=UPI00268DDA8E
MSEQAGRLGSRTVLDASLILAVRVVSRLVALVVVLKLASHLGAERYGQYATLIAYSALVSVVADFGLSSLYTREAARAPARLPIYLATLLLGKLPLAAAAAALLGGALLSARLGGLFLPGALLLALTTYATLIRNTFYAQGRLEFEAIAILAETVIQAGGIFLGARFGQGIAYFVWVYAASYGFTCVYSLLVIRVAGLAQGSTGVDGQLLRTWLKLAFPFALGSFLTNLYFRADVPILQHFRAYQEVGWYQLAYKPFEALQFVPLAVQAVVYPLLGVYHQEPGPRLAVAYGRFFKILILLGWPLSVGTLLLAHPIGRLFRLFPESEPSLRILSLAIVFLFANSCFTAMLYAIDRQDLFAWATGLAVVVNVGLNLILIPLYGYLAASATTVVTEAAFSVAGWYFVGRRFKLPLVRLSWRILLAGLIMGVVLVPLAGRSIFLSAPSGALVYGLGLVLLRAIEREELDLFLRGLRLRR